MHFFAAASRPQKNVTACKIVCFLHFFATEKMYWALRAYGYRPGRRIRIRRSGPYQKAQRARRPEGPETKRNETAFERRLSVFERRRSALERRILIAETKKKRGADSGKIKLKRRMERIREKLIENKLLNQAFSVDFNKG